MCQKGVGIAGIDGNDAREAGNPGIAGRGNQLADIAIEREASDECVLACAAADDQNSH